MNSLIKAFEEVVDHNSKNENKKTLHITYKKLNGRTVKRKIDPGVIKNGLIIAYDHKRKATRSFKIDRIKNMKKIAAEYMDRSLSEEEKKQIREQMQQQNVDPDNHIKYLTERQKKSNTRSNLGYLGALGLGVGSMVPKNPWIRGGMMAGAGLSGMLGYAGELDGASAGVARSFVQQAHEKKAFHKGFQKTANAKAQAVIDHVKNHYGKYLAGAGGLYVGGKIGHGVGRKKGQEEGVGAGYNMAMQQMQPEQEKQAEAFAHGAELAGLGILAAPSVAHMMGKKVSEKNQHRAELAGLGVLAAPSLVHFAKGLSSKFKKAV
jgi:hypothetical protein